nr:hypothetical protein [Bacteroides sp.]
MRRLVYMVWLMVAACVATSCVSDTEQRLRAAADAVATNPDTALVILDGIRRENLRTDKQVAEFAYIKGYATASLGRSLLTDTLLDESAAYFRSQGDTLRWCVASKMLAARYYVSGDYAKGAAVIDTVLEQVSQPELQWELRCGRMELAFLQQDLDVFVSDASWLACHTTKPEDLMRYSTMVMAGEYMRGNTDIALQKGRKIAESDFLPAEGTGAWAEFMCDYAHILEGAGKSDEALRVMERVEALGPAPDATEHESRLLSLAQFRLSNGDTSGALAALDSLNEANLAQHPEAYVRAGILRSAIEYKKTGKLPVNELVMIPKRAETSLRLALLDRMTALETVHNLYSENYRLALERQRLWLVISVVITALLIVVTAGWLLLSRRRKLTVEAEERAEALQTLVKELKERPESKLKNSLLRHFDILKAFAEAPTAQNRAALRTISLAGGGDGLVDWDALYAAEDDLYDGFYSRLVAEHPQLTEKEVQIICLIRAGFSTKEIGVLTEQSSATIYVRKTAIRKKLATPADGDFIAQLTQRQREAADD